MVWRRVEWSSRTEMVLTWSSSSIVSGSRFEVFWLVKLIICVVSRFSCVTLSTAHIHREVQSGDDDLTISRINS